MEEEHEQSEEEEEAEEAINDFWQIDYAGDQADDASNDGCIWMWVLLRLGNGRSGRHAVEGMRYPNFADMWGFIMREPAQLVPLEGLCRMEADLRPAFLSRELYGKGIYQESIAIVAEGGLETVIEKTGDTIASMLK